MTTRAEIEALIKRLEEAKEGSRELDVEIGTLLGLCDHSGPAYHRPYKDWARHYTTNVDAALTLVPADGFWEVGRIAADDSPMRHFGGGHTHRAVCGRWGGPAHQAYRSTPALALCIASLRARLSSMKDDANG